MCSRRPTMRISRRRMMQAAGAAAMAPPAMNAATMPGPRFEGKDTPKICLEASLSNSAPPPDDPNEAIAAAARRVKQLGVDYVISGGGRIPWTEDSLRARIDQLKSHGLTLGNLMISGFNRAIYNSP